MTENNELVKVESQDKSWDEALKTETWISPDVNIYENEENYFIQAVMPGVERTNIKVRIEDGHLILMGRISFDETNNRSYILKENQTGNFYRKFKFSESVDESKISAKLENGLLTVSLAKSDRIKTKIIDIL